MASRTHAGSRRRTGVALVLAMVAGLLSILTAAPAGAAPVTDVVVARGHSSEGIWNLPTGSPGSDLLLDTANFGPTGTVVVNSLTIQDQTSTVTPAYLSTVDIYFDGWVFDSTWGETPAWTPPELDAIENWVAAGGVLILNEDLPTADQLGQRFGATVQAFDEAENVSPFTPEGSAGAHPIVAGPFGTWASVEPSGVAGHFGLLLGGSWTTIAEDPSLNDVIATRAFGAGRVILTGDLNLFTQDPLPAGNEDLFLNMFAYAISETDDTLALVSPGDQFSDIGVFDSVTVHPLGGPVAGLTFSDGGTLPAGLSISAGGVISGTPSASGTTTDVTITATPTTGSPVDVVFDWVVGTPLGMADPGDQSNQIGDTVSLAAPTLSNGDGSTPTWTVNALPAGLSIDAATGEISGTPTTAGSTSVTITATPTHGAAASETFDWDIFGALTVTDPGAQMHAQNEPLSVDFDVTGGDGSTVTWSATSLPAGLDIDENTGVVTGTPTTSQVVTATITAMDTSGTADLMVSWTITDDLMPIAVNDGAVGMVGEPFELDLCSNDTLGEGTNTVTPSGVIPAGLGLVDCILSGTPTAAGNFQFSYTLTDVDGDSDMATVDLSIAPEPVPDPDPDPVLCDNVEATIVGTDGDDVIQGTPGDDVIHGLGGNDVINGLGGADIICGGDGADTINGGGGADDLHGEKGADTINGGRGADTISGNAGADTINGGNGADRIDGNGGADTISGGKKADTIFGGNGTDEIDGNGGADTISGGKKADMIRGGGGDDDLRGNGGPDEIRGGKGIDTCAGGGGADTEFGCEL